MTDEQILEIAEEQSSDLLTSEHRAFCINFARALLSASIADTADNAQCDTGKCGIGGYCKECPSIADTATVPTDLLPNALWTRRGSGTDEWWSFKGYQARKDAADQWVLRKGGEELYRHTYLQVVMAHAEREILAGAESIADTAGEIRSRALDEAAKICDKWADHYGDEESTGQQFACDRCADSIRDLFAAPPAPSVADTAGAKPDDYEPEPTPESDRAARNATTQFMLIRCVQLWRAKQDMKDHMMWVFNWLREQGISGKALGDSTVKLATPPAPSVADIEDPVIAPRDLLIAACSAIDKKRNAPNTLAALRAITMAPRTAPSVADAVGASDSLFSLCRKVWDEAMAFDTGEDGMEVDEFERARDGLIRSAIAKESGND